MGSRSQSTTPSANELILMKNIMNDTGLEMETIEILKKTYDDLEKKHGEEEDGLRVESIGPLLGIVGIRPNKADLEDALNELVDIDINEDNLDFSQVCQIAARFQDEGDERQMTDELRQAFRLYDKEQHGYISTLVLKEIITEIEPDMPTVELDMIIEEIDEDHTGRVTFEQFQGMMMG